MRQTTLRRLIACILAAALLTPCLPVSAGNLETHWAAAEMSRAVEEGWLVRRDDGQYRPDDAVTRAELAAMINRMKGYSAGADLAGFSDVSPADWYYAELAAAVTAGYLSGYDGRLNPSGELTRSEAAAIFTRLAGIPILDNELAALTRVPDAGALPDWARPYAAAAISQGLIAGADGRFDGGRSISRAELVVLLGRLYDNTRVFGFSGSFTLMGEAERVLVSAPDVQLTVCAAVTSLTVLPAASGARIIVETSGSVKQAAIQAPAAFRGMGPIASARVQSGGVSFAVPPSLTVIDDGLTALIGGTEVSGTVYGDGAAGGISGGGGSSGGSTGGGGGGTTEPAAPAVSALRLIGTHTVEVTLNQSVPDLTTDDFKVTVDGAVLTGVVPESLSPVTQPIWPFGADEFALVQDSERSCRILLGGGLDTLSAAANAAVTVSIAGSGNTLGATARTVVFSPPLALSALAVTGAATLTLTLEALPASALGSAELSRILMDFYSTAAPPSTGAEAIVPVRLTHTAGSAIVTMTIPDLTGRVGLLQVYRSNGAPLVAQVDFAAPRVAASAAVRNAEEGGSLNLLTDEDCTLSIIVRPGGQGAPTAAALAAGPFLPPDRFAWGENGCSAVWNLEELTAGAGYTVYFMARDSAGNQTGRLSLPLTAAVPNMPSLVAGESPAREGMTVTAARLGAIQSGETPFFTLEEEERVYRLSVAAGDLAGLTLTLGGIAPSAPVGLMVSRPGGELVPMGVISGSTVPLFGLAGGDTVLLYTNEDCYAKVTLDCILPVAVRAIGLESGEGAVVTVDGEDYTLTAEAPSAVVYTSQLSPVAIAAAAEPGRSVGIGVALTGLSGAAESGFTLAGSAGGWSFTPAEVKPHLLVLNFVPTPSPLTARVSFRDETVTLDGGPVRGLYEVVAVPEGGGAAVVEGGLYEAVVALGEYGLIPSDGSSALLASFRLSPFFGMPAAEAVTVSLPPRPPAPLAGSFTIVQGGADMLLLAGAGTDLEYTILAEGADIASEWAACTGENLALLPGDTVCLRVAATVDSFASAPLTLTALMP